MALLGFASVRSAAIALLFLFPPCAARCADGAIRSALEYCAKFEQTIHLSDDDKILCFDGQIKRDLKMQPFQELKENGFFVIRSPGGYSTVAVEMSDILLAKNATVIIHDYCLSACANYVLVATNRTYVVKDSIVAWHGGPSGVYCTRWFTGDEKTVNALEDYCNHVEVLSRFFAKRGISAAFAHWPQTAYTRNRFRLYLAGTGDRRSIFWMWNPRNYGDYFKDRLTFESYPASQYEVNEILSRFGLEHVMRVLYDPPE